MDSVATLLADMCMERDEEPVRGAIGRLGTLVGGATIMPPLGALLVLGTLDVVGPWLSGQPEIGVVVYILGFILLAGLALLPTYAQAILGGWAFGFTIGFPAAMMGFVGAAWLAHELVRRAAPGAMHALDDRPRWRAIRRALVGRSFWQTTALVALVRMAPATPFAIVNVIMTGVGVSRGAFLLGTALGLAPRVGVVVYAAAGVAHWREAQVSPGWTWLAGLAATIGLVTLLTVIAARALRSIADEQIAVDEPVRPDEGTSVRES